LNGSITNSSTFQSAVNSKYYILLFILWPFLAFVTAVANYRQKESRKVVFTYLVYFGLTIIVGAGMDSSAYAENLKFNASLPFSDFFKIVGGLYTSDTSVDIIEPLISFVISRFTSDYRILFATFAAIFGFFYLKSINLLYTRYQAKPGWNSLIYMVYFTTIVSIININGFRMWTASWVFFYGAYYVILYGERRYLLLTIGSCLIHWSFISANIVLLIYFFVGNRNLIYLPIMLASFVLPNSLSPFFNSISMRLGGGIQSRYSGYTNEEYIMSVQEHAEQTKMFVSLSKEMIFYYLIMIIALIYIFNNKLIKDKAEKNLLSFLILFLSFVNFGKGIPSFGNRFQIVFIMFSILFVFIYHLKLPNDKINFFTLFGLVPMALYTAVEFRIGSELINAWIFLPGFGLPLLVPGISLAALLFY
jgi:hypothetical protein